jgi:hypothetical protein
MKTLSLKLDDLCADSFQTSTEPETRGTVGGNQRTVIGNTCAPTCPYTCGIMPATNDCALARDTPNCPVCG